MSRRDHHRDGEFDALREVLSHGRDGEPRMITIEVRDTAAVAALARRAAEEGRARGFVPIGVDAYLRAGGERRAAIGERALLLIAGSGKEQSMARTALVDAASRSARAHVLVQFARAGNDAPIARDGRVAYAASPVPAGAAMPADVKRLLEQASRASVVARGGRHAAAERLLREAVAGLLRRQALEEATDAAVRLGRLLLERGRADDADEAFAEAARAAQKGERHSALVTARLWQAAARTDAARLTDAESICRALLLSPLSRAHGLWARAVLGRVLLWQERDSGEAIGALAAEDREALGAVTSAFVEAVAVRMLLQEGELFAAGERVRAAVDAADATGEPIARAIAHTARLRHRAAAGDLADAAASLRVVAACAREARAPLRAVRARLVWAQALRRAARHREADAGCAALARLKGVVPPLLRRALDRQSSDTAGRPARPRCGVVENRCAAALVELVHQDDDDAAAVRRVLERVCAEVQASRLELLSCDAGPVTTLEAIGSGLATHLGTRVLEAGIPIGPMTQEGGHETGVPVRVATRLIGAIVARWPPDRCPVRDAPGLLALAAAIVAPRLDLHLAGARVTARAAADVPELVGVSAAMADVRRAIVRAASAPFAVLIEGESGSGKELAARAIHQLGPRRERRFCDVNCAAIPEELLDSELFGHARGAFTGAVADRAGLFEEADGGTLFLDEVADLSPRGQAKLLRVLQQHEVRRVGETFSRAVDVRLVAAANRDMRGEAAERRFRADLLYRLDVIRIPIPPLRERADDVPLLAEHFWRAAASRVGTSAVLTHDLLAALARYHWPGNIRELQNVIAALAVAAPSRGRVPASLLPPAVAGAATVSAVRLAEARAQLERRCIEVALARAAGNKTRAAAQLGLSRQGLLKTMARLGLLANAGRSREE